MKNPIRVALFIIFVALTAIRLLTLKLPEPNVVSWDGLGYYLYLPGGFIYDDLGKLEWLPHILETYHPTPHLYQVVQLDNGNFAMKYLMGLSIFYGPFFGLGHLAAGVLDYPQDGFSLPYQLSICLASLLYAFAGIWILANVLRRYFTEPVVAVTLLLLALATNYPEYTAVQAGQTHGYLFTAYALMLWLTIRWHEKPTLPTAFSIGLLVGLAAITRPTDGVMLFIPLLWQSSGFDKWKFVRQHLSHLWVAGGGMFFGVLPQLIYWKAITGDWVFDVGSKWFFLNPWWRVLFGWEKGWFIYTPITIFMVVGLFFMKNRPFKQAVTVFFILNTWIIIAWSDWRYGGSYSSRALLQGCAVLSLPLAVVVEKIIKTNWKMPAVGLGLFLVFLNLFQIWQYQRSIIHYGENNFDYYRAIFLDPSPTPLDMSLLDTKEILRSESGYTKETLFQSGDSMSVLAAKQRPEIVFWEKDLAQIPTGSERWLHISTEVKSAWGAFGAHLDTELILNGQAVKSTACRLENGICKKGEWNKIEYYFKIPIEHRQGTAHLVAKTDGGQEVFLKNVRIEFLHKK
jgi:hypothetical protein